MDLYGGFGATLTLNGQTKRYSYAALDPNTLDPTNVAHEMGHGYGLPHSYSDNPPMEYGNHWDVMSSWTSVWPFNPADDVPDHGWKGPGFNAYHRIRMGWIPADRIMECIPPDRCGSGANKLAPLERHENAGYLAIRIPRDNGTYLLVEYRTKDGWDSGIPNDAVIVHRVTPDGYSYLVPSRGASLNQKPGGARPFTVDGIKIHLKRAYSNYALVYIWPAA